MGRELMIMTECEFIWADMNNPTNCVIVATNAVQYQHVIDCY